MKPSFRDFEHLVRLAGLFLVGLLVFAVARAAYVPKDFGKYGHYRPGSLDDEAAHTPIYAGRARCVECHEDVVAIAAPSRHKNLGCEGCHGALKQHADNPEVAVPQPDGRADCMRCHSARTGRPANFLNIDAEEHSGADACVSCHKPHDPRAESGESNGQNAP
ncbi:MAG: cytochrome c3 family protein [Vicinamibacterales bacterium]